MYQAEIIEAMQKDFEESFAKIQNQDDKQTNKIEKNYSVIINELETKLEKAQ